MAAVRSSGCIIGRMLFYTLSWNLTIATGTIQLTFVPFSQKATVLRGGGAVMACKKHKLVPGGLPKFRQRLLNDAPDGHRLESPA